MSTRNVALACLALMFAPQFSSAQELADPRDRELGATERLEALLERARVAQQDIRTLEAKFTQFKQSAMLMEPDEASGVFSYSAPDKVRWEYLTPKPVSLLIRDGVMTTWYREVGRAEEVNVGKRSQRILQYLGAGTSLDDLLQYFVVSMTVPKDKMKPYLLDLTPKFDKVAKRIRGMSLWIDGESYLPVKLHYEEPDGDVTEYLFEGYEINGEIPVDRFELALPASVDLKVVRLGQRTGS